MHPSELKISDYHYDLPDARIAKRAVEPRDAAQLLCWRDGRVLDQHVSDLPELLRDWGMSHLVLNEARVIQARLFFPRPSGEGAPVEVFYLEPESLSIEEAMQSRGSLRAWVKARPAKKWKAGASLELLASDTLPALRAQRVDTLGDRILTEFTWDSDHSWSALLEALGHVPLPPYFHRDDDIGDRDRYQTVFARVAGSVAAPTAGLHLTHGLLRQVEDCNIQMDKVTLHVGAGTFQPVSAEQVGDHAMHAEIIDCSIEMLRSLASAKGVAAVGTTTTRSIESAYWLGVDVLEQGQPSEYVDQWRPYREATTAYSREDALGALADWLELEGLSSWHGSTAIMIAPPYTFRVVDVLLTNFHQPQSTLLLLVAAGIGPEWVDMYDHAMITDYRFLSYGDACLLDLRSH